MGIFQFIKEIREDLKKREKYIKMDIQELAILSDEDLRVALSERLMVEEEKNGWDVDECLSKFKGAKRIYYIVNYFDMEVQNGGLCQFFVNSSRKVAPYILQSLNEIGANNYEKILTDFVKKNRININDLDSFVTETVEDYEEQLEKYPFDDFDDKYYELYGKEPLEDILIVYAKQNLNDFEIC